ncbi:restriction endonuclease S subunit [Nostoc sp. PCC 7524]|uniref:restriction endonuclease subunit S n=1 Tax=Nostoc sp. (strain ATCC 29411 / PCC 7524) TaxID=28072 RepID=UPI00029F4218|nr:restriction endonuclease subunit S [Nostoc sp. PCC 7524]AFY47528.1 restriction endonuclease S subunit [Nostoc sp. PCC 7524]
MREVLVKNEEFKDSPVGKIPQDWDVELLSTVSKKIQDGTHFSPKSKEGNFRYITSKNIRFGYLDLTDCGWISKEEHEKIYSRCDVHYEDVLLTKDGVNTGNAAINTLSEPFSLLSSVAFIRPDKNQLNAKYLLQYILSPIGQRRLTDMMSGLAITRLTLQKIQSFEIPIPSLSEQQRIAEILDTVDEAIARTSSLIIKLKQTKAGLLQDLLTRGLDEDGKLRDPEAHPEQFKDSPLGKIPQDWEVVSLVSLCHRITDGSHQSVKTSDNGVPFLYVSCVRDGKILWEQAAKIPENTYAEISKGREPVPGLILYTAVGSYGHAALVRENYKFSFQRHIAYVLPNKETIAPEYLVTFLNSPQCRKYSDQVALGNAQKTVTLTALCGFPIALPELTEQLRIAEILDIHDTRIRTEEAYLNKLKLQKQGLMQDLLTGKVRVRKIK